MNDPKDYLRQMIDSTVAGDSEGAEKAFKDFIVPRSADFMNGNQEAEPAAEPAETADPVEPKAESESK